MTREKKKSLTITLPPEIIKYLETKVESREFSSLSHAVEVCILRYMKAHGRVIDEDDE